MDQNVEVNALANATRGFDRLFENDIAGARALFNARDDPFHQLGLGVCAFLEAALGMEAHIIEEAHRCLTLAEAGTRKFTKTRMAVENHRFHPGLEWEIINTDTVVLLGLVNALSETYMGYLQCLYALNSAHSKFTRLYKTVFPNGVDSYTPSPPPPPGAISRETSFAGSVSYSSESSVASSTSTLPASPDVPDSKPVKRGFFSRLASSGTSSTPSLNVAHHRPHLHPAKPDGPVDDLIVAGTAFGYGLFNLVFSLLPKRIQSVVGFFGFKHDRKLALKALAVAAARNDTHSVFAGLVLMTYHGGVLLLSGYQANESRIVAEYQELVDRVFDRFPNGALWILNKAKILRMCHNPDAAINVLQDGLKPDRAFSFAQADALLVFELAWTLLSERRYDEAAKMFLRMTELNTWSHATYYYIAAGCHWSLGNMEKAQELFDRIPGFVDKKLGGKELPTEVFLKKKIAFYKAKQKRLGENEAKFVEAITISPSDEMGLFWNTHARISESVALLHIREWYSTAPVPPIVSPHRPPSASPPPTRAPTPALDTPDEFALRALLLGVVHRTIKSYDTSREFLNDACERQENIEISTWIGGIANFELAVLELKEAEAFENAYYSTNGSTTTGSSTPATPASTEPSTNTQSAMAMMDRWKQAFKIATANLDKAMSLATSSTDLSSRLDTRVSMLRDEIASKKELIGL